MAGTSVNVVRLLTLVLCSFGGAVWAQAPRIDVLDFYGLRKVPEAKVRQTLAVKEGDPLPHSKGDTEEHLDDIPGIVESHLEAVYDAGKTILYVGVEDAALLTSTCARLLRAT